MTDLFFKLDVGITEHPKFVGLSADAWTLWLHGTAYAARNLTDGHIPGVIVGRLANIRNAARTATELEAAGLWERDRDGWRIHDYLDHNRSAADADAAKTAQTAGGTRGNHKRWHVDRGIVDPDCPHCQPSPTPSGKRSGGRAAPDSPTDRLPIAESESELEVDSQSVVTDTHDTALDEPGPTDDQAPGVNDHAIAAATELGRRDHAAAITDGVPIRRPDAHLAACIRRRLDDTTALAAAHPDWTIDQLVDALAPPEPAPPPVTRLPDLVIPPPVDRLDPAAHSAALAAARAAIDTAALHGPAAGVA